MHDQEDMEVTETSIDPIPFALKIGAPEAFRFPENTVNKNKDLIPFSQGNCGITKDYISEPEEYFREIKCNTEIKTQNDLLQNELKSEHLLDSNQAQNTSCETKQQKIYDIFTEPKLPLKNEDIKKTDKSDLLPKHLEDLDNASTMLSMRTLCDTKEDIDGPIIDQCKLEPELSLKVEEPLELSGLNDPWNGPRPGCEAELKLNRKLGYLGYPCNQCEVLCRSEQSLLDHVNAVHLGIRFQCQVCDFTTKRKRDLQPHVKQKHEGVKFPCDKCDYITGRIQDLKTHMKSKHLGVTYPCPECDFVGKYRASLWQHRKTVHQGVQYSCDQCEYKSSTPQNLKEHRQQKHDGITFPCDECEKVMSSAYTLAKHKKNIHEGIKYHCNECEYVGNSLIYLRKHKQNNHGETHSCHQCKYVTNNMAEMKKHKRKVHEGIRYPCDECGDEFRDPPSLKQHVDSIHRGIRFHCDQCEYAGAANMSILRRHMKAKHGGI